MTATSGTTTPRSCSPEATLDQCGSLVGGAEVDGEGEDSVGEGGLGVADHGEILVVGLGLGDEALAFLAADGRKVALLHGFGPVAETLQHFVEIKSFRHVPTVALKQRPALVPINRRLGAEQTTPKLNPKLLPIKRRRTRT